MKTKIFFLFSYIFFIGAISTLIENNTQEKKENITQEKEKCKSDLKCWGEEYAGTATFECMPHIEKLAKYDYKWTDKFLELKFDRFRWENLDKNNIIYSGNKIKFQNGFGAWQHMNYACIFDPKNNLCIGCLAQ